MTMLMMIDGLMMMIKVMMMIKLLERIRGGHHNLFSPAPHVTSTKLTGYEVFN